MMRTARGRPYRSRYRQRESRWDSRRDSIVDVLLLQCAICVAILASLYLVRVFSPDTAMQIGARLERTLGEQRYSISVQTAAERLKDGINGILVFLYPEPEQEGLPVSGSGAQEELKAFCGDGQGGWFPVDLWGEAQMMQPPVNAVLSPIIVTAPAKAPLSGKITSYFGYRMHPITGEADFHTGIDIAAPSGTAITAVYPGYVEEVRFSSVYGNVIVLLHSGGLKTAYSHCEKILAPVGANIRQGERIALVGSTGISTGAHLHFEIMLGGIYADPMWIFDKERLFL